MHVKIKQLNGSSFDLLVSPLDSIIAVKRRIQLMHDFQSDSMRLICKGKNLENDKTLNYYEITDGLILYLVTSHAKEYKEQKPQKINGFYKIGTKLKHIKTGIIVTVIQSVGAGYPHVMLPDGKTMIFEDFDEFEP